MICTVSTVLDTPAHLTRFVDANLRMGVDHMVLVIDWPQRPDQAEVIATFAHHRQVTLVLGDDAWWAGRRPGGLNRRQVINANRVLFALRGLGQESWLFHIDADEVLDLGPTSMSRVARNTPALQVRPLESVAVWEAPEYETRFKAFPSRAELEQYAAWGVIDRPMLAQYFHGHYRGKVGVRIGGGVRLGLHNALTPDGDRYLPDWALDQQMLHFHTRSGADALAKALSFALNDDGVGLPAKKQGWIEAMQALASEPDGAVREQRSKEIFDTYLADRVELMEQHGLVVRVDPREHHHTPQPFTPQQQGQFAAELAEVPRRRQRLFIGILPEGRRSMFGDYPGDPARGIKQSKTITQRA